jgi:hypothetical protein
MFEYIKIGCIIFSSCFAGTYLGSIVFDYLNKPKFYEIRTCEDLKAINNDLDGTYILMNDIDGKDCK